MVLEIFRSEAPRLLVHDVLGQVQRVLGDFDVLDLVEILLLAAHFVRIAQQPAPSAPFMRSEALSHKPGCAGAIAFCRTGDPATGEFGDAKLIRKFGDVLDDLSAL